MAQLNKKKGKQIIYKDCSINIIYNTSNFEDFYDIFLKENINEFNMIIKYKDFMNNYY